LAGSAATLALIQKHPASFTDIQGCAMKNVEDVYPLSPMQEGMLFDALYEPGPGAYVIQVSSKIEGDCNIPAFQHAWQEILGRYPSLRSAFVWDRVERPLQVVRKQVSLTRDQPDWRGLLEEDQEKKIKSISIKSAATASMFLMHRRAAANSP
jgi:hypothetical protein